MRLRCGVWLAMLVLAAMVGGSLAASAAEADLDVPYVPTPEDVVTEMLKVAAVGKDDVLYDLGCGDGRIVITAVSRLGARKGVGIDIDPERIKECEVNVRKAAVADRVTFLQQDLFDTDFSEASVVTLYLLPNINMRLRPALFRQLRPGDRVVSHDFHMKEWEPDKTVEVASDDAEATVYYWTMPGPAAGTWHWTLPKGDGREPYRLRLRQRFQTVSGTLEADGQPQTMTDLRIRGGRLSFTLVREVEGKKATAAFSGRIAGDSLSGIVVGSGGPVPDAGEWRARRDAVTPLGSWNWTVDGKPAVLRVSGLDGRRYANLVLDGKRRTVRHFYVWGAGVYFFVDRRAEQVYEGVIEGDRIVGTVSRRDGEPQPWSATRAPAGEKRVAGQSG